MRDNSKALKLMGIISVAFFVAIFLIVTIISKVINDDAKYSITDEDNIKTYANDEEAKKELSEMISKIVVTEVPATKVPVELTTTDLKDELPDINKTPLSVEGKNEINIEIFSSTEKSSSGTDGWLKEMAEKFNASGATIDGKTVSVSIRPIASGLAVDYIVSEKYVPDAFTPSNELWGKMVESKGTSIELVEDKMVGNVAGILLEKEKYDELIAKYGKLDMKAITTATTNNEIVMGYTNPFASSTGLNFLISTLNAYDNKDILSNTAKEGFNEFQANVPFVAYTTLQMRDAATSGSLSGFIMEYQTLANATGLENYVFTPFGVRHDNPMYSLEGISNEKKDALKLFVEYCQTSEAQKTATEYGFNNYNDYKAEVLDVSGNELVSAQKLWKENKDVGRPISAVFIADVSGSMDGEPINKLKDSLINASQYINDNNSVGLVSYDSDVYINLPIAKFDLNQRSYFNGSVNDLVAMGGTASFDGVLVGLDMLLKEKEANPDAKLMMFLLSDGDTNYGHTLDEVRGLLEYYGISVFTIGYNANIEALEAISSINEGASINADSDDVIYKLKNLFNAQM